jgi:tetratricopeptide (TPR) repeat protein
MLGWEEETTRYGLHDLARLFADARLSEAEREFGRLCHAYHYLNLLSHANELYDKGGKFLKRGLSLFDLERRNIEAGQAWVERRFAAHKTVAEMCISYPVAGQSLLELLQHPRERIRWLEAGLTAARRLESRNDEAVILNNLGLAHRDLGELPRAIEYHEQALTIIRDLGEHDAERHCLNNLGLSYNDLGETGRAVELFEQALPLHRKMGDRRAEGATLGNLGLAHNNVGDARRALEYFEQALAIDREIGDRRGEGQDLGNMGTAYLLLGETRRAVEFYEQRLAIAREIGDRPGEGNALFNIGLALHGLGERERAIAHAEGALEIYEQLESPHAANARAAVVVWGGEA